MDSAQKFLFFFCSRADRKHVAFTAAFPIGKRAFLFAQRFLRRLHFPRSRCGFPFRRPHAFLLSFRFPSSERRKTAVFAARLLNFPPVFPAFSAPLPVAHGVRFPREFPYCQGSVRALPIFVFPHFFRFLSIVQNPRLLRIPYSAIASLFFVYSNFPRLSHSYKIVLFPAKSPRRPCPVRFPPFKFLRCPSHKNPPSFPQSPAALSRRRFFPYIQMSFLSQNAAPPAPNAAKKIKKNALHSDVPFSPSLFSCVVLSPASLLFASP